MLSIGRFFDPLAWTSFKDLVGNLCEAFRIGDDKAVDACLAELTARGRLSDALNEPPSVLAYAANGEKPSYPNIIKLLQLKVRPELPNSYNVNMFRFAAATQSLTLFRLLLWFEADGNPEQQYERLTKLPQSGFRAMERWQSRKPAEADPGVIADWWKSRPTYVALSVIERWQWSNSTIIETLAEIAADFRHARQQLRDAERALNERDYQAAGLCYAEVAGICLKHCRSEEVIVRMVQEQAARIGQPSPDLDYDNVLKAKKEVDAHIEVVPEFFAAQALEYQQKAYANLLLADAAEPQPEPGQRLNLSEEKRQERYRVLSVLAQLAQSFGEIPAANT